MSKFNSGFWYDISGKVISSGRVTNVDLKAGKGEYEYRAVCDRCFGSGVVKQFYRSQCTKCHSTGYLFSSKRDVFTLNALFTANRPVACRIYRSIKALPADSTPTVLDIWLNCNLGLVNQIKQRAADNSFLKSLLKQLTAGRILTEKQLSAAKWTLEHWR
ncbi:hypothetical protein [Yersinia intermedia]|uniref:hypothetical protein n=1 Tax=Yersinia intermedia TaxID=631 RepID=UPI00065D00E5|nr:hypothetical protein [Yersinia intermedia]CRY83986.1 Uncharacterised protein [Yersinia intermedia]